VDKRLLFISRTYVGKEHDFSILKEELPPGQNWFSKFEVKLDLGYQGFKDEYDCLKVSIPVKKKKNFDLTDDQKAENKAKSSERINVEHSIGGMKRYRILSERLRMHDFKLFEEIIGVCAGLWNFNLKYATL
jgi:hypothetical protein